MKDVKSKLIEVQVEYIKFLEKALTETHQIAALHHYKALESDIKKGKALRNLIKEYSDKLN